MRRQVKRIAVCLVVGVVVNVLVAWGVQSSILQRVHYRSEHGEGNGLKWAVCVPKNWPAPTQWELQKRIGWTELRQTTEVSNSGQHGDVLSYCAIRSCWGWPLRSLASYGWIGWSVNRHPLSSSGIAVHDVAIDLDVWAGARGFAVHWRLQRLLGISNLPVHPLWLGFVVNTLVYGGFAWGVLFAPGVVKRWRRRRRGACVGCGYELAGLVRCPECGK